MKNLLKLINSLITAMHMMYSHCYLYVAVHKRFYFACKTRSNGLFLKIVVESNTWHCIFVQQIESLLRLLSSFLML